MEIIMVMHRKKLFRNIASSSLMKPLTLKVNQVLHTGIFPRQLKLSRVKPMHTSGEHAHFCNYRP